MNRIILIGNGFDLAHGLKTKYEHFLDYYWQKKISKINHLNKGKYEDEDILIKSIPSFMLQSCTSYSDLKETLTNFKEKIYFHNHFLEKITNHKDVEKWVDIENMYYKELKLSFNTNNTNSYYFGKIKKLNEHFEIIKRTLVDYLSNEVKSFNEKLDTDDSIRLNKRIGSIIYSKYRLKDLSESTINKKVKEQYNIVKQNIELINNGVLTKDDLDYNTLEIYKQFKDKLTEQKFKSFILDEYYEKYFDLFPEQTLLLNFNYTSNTDLYNKPSKYNYPGHVKGNETNIIQIHGSIEKNKKNPIIFGYGDELDDKYSEIEKLDDNNYLENIKSIKYLETDNYKKLLEFVNSNDYQVFVFGHSCGTSDRTMLNTLFEHENCASIKVYYHHFNQGDNYSDVIRNISRNFNDKAKMRDKVVNKKYSEPLVKN